MNNWLIMYRRFRVLPVTMLVVLVAMLVRVESVQINAKKGLFITTATVQAEDKADEHGADAKKDEHAKDDKKEDKKDEHAKDDKKSDEAHDEAAKPEEPIDPLDVSKQEDRNSSELAILQELADRRHAIEQREAALVEKEALQKAGEARFDEKIQELTKLRNEIKDLVDKAKVQEDDEIKRLVVVYEKMKPKEAAGIFNSMGMNILLPIAKGMKETKLSPVLASMSPDKARQLTDLLYRQSQVLPQDTPVRAAAEAAASEALPNLPPPPAE